MPGHLVNFLKSQKMCEKVEIRIRAELRASVERKSGVERRIGVRCDGRNR